MSGPLVLVTNDDGVDAPGLRAVAEALSALGEVHVVAPDREMSASSQALTMDDRVRAAQVGPRTYAVNGTPADCVGMAIRKLLGSRPALLVSGINTGANLGEDVFYSGTVGGAREGSFYGVPSIAVSLAVSPANREAPDFSTAAQLAARLAGLVLERRLPAGTLLNVNVPPGRPTTAVITVQARQALSSAAGAAWDEARSWGLEADPWDRDELSDIEAVRQGLVSITPLHTDTTHHAALRTLQKWAAALRDGRDARILAPGPVPWYSSGS